jgi:uncharacterized protein
MLRRPRAVELVAFFVLACAITWTCAAPLVVAWSTRQEPSPLALALAPVSAFGPTLAAAIVARWRGELRQAFRPWRTHPGWVVVALFLPMGFQVCAVAIERLLGGTPSAWIHLPETSEHVAALVVFSIGEELGWRGWAQPRMVARFGWVKGPLLLGVGWALWHAAFLVSPDTGSLDPMLGFMLASLLPWSILYAWLMTRGGGSIAIAIGLHAGAHLDNMSRLPADEVRLRIVTLVLVTSAAVFAARSLVRRG